MLQLTHMGLEADVFHMLIERLGAVEDSMREIRSDLDMILLPRLHDVSPLNVNAIKDRLKEQDIVRALASRANGDHGSLLGNLPDKYIQQLKAQGFRVYQTTPQRLPHTLDAAKQTYILWGEQQLDENLLHNVWVSPEDFVQL